MPLDEILKLILTLAGGDPAVSASHTIADHQVLVVDLEGALPGAKVRHTAQLRTQGVEEFYLSLDGRYEYRDFEYEPDRQPEVITEMVGLAKAYLMGAGRLVPEGRIWNRRGSLQITVGGSRYSLTPLEGG